MQSIVIDKPYIPVPPHRGKIWPALLSHYVPRLLRKKYGVTEVDCVHGFPSLLVTYGTSCDLFFSGHTAIAVYGALALADALGPIGIAIGCHLAR